MSAHQRRWCRFVRWVGELFDTGCGARRPHCPPLSIEKFEDKCLLSAALPIQPAPLNPFPGNPAQGVFFTDANNQLWMYNANTQQFTNTGGYAEHLAGGVDAQGNPEVFFTDANDRLWRWDNGTFTNTGGYALQVRAGQGLVAFIDGNNELWTFSDSAGFFVTGRTVPLYFVSSDWNFSVGWDAAGNNLVAFLDDSGQLWTLSPGADNFTNTGAFGLTLAVGRDAQGFNQVYFDDSNGLLYRYDQGQFVNTGVSLTPYFLFGSQAGFYFSSATSGQDGFGFNPLFNESYSDSQNTTTMLASPGSPLCLTNELTASPGSSDAFLTDDSNQIWMFQNGVATATAGFARQLSAF
jgi:hypothetical protein